MNQKTLSFQFISEPSDVNFGGKVHGGAVMKWIDEVGFACASNWSQAYCVTIYVGGIRFFRPIHIGDLVKLDANIIYTGKTSMHIAVDVFSRNIKSSKLEPTTHCIIVFVAVDQEGKPVNVPLFEPKSESEIALQNYAIKLMDLRKQIENEMTKFMPV